TAIAQRAGIARATLQRAEQGAPAVAIGTYLRILGALGCQQDVEQLARPVDGERAAVPAPRHHPRLAKRIRVRDYPQLRQLAWQLKDDAELEPAEAFGLYERHWRYVDADRLDAAERALIERLKHEHGAGVMLV
ncbi:MAG TPA: XRE family transcriptional regulator, partial [Albitalea sp.]|nr:XRE family transcriptional regulator [Albitalea sp.]